MFFRAIVTAMIIGGLNVPLPTLAQKRETPQTRTQIRLSFAPVVKSVAPAVVNIRTTPQEFSRRSPMFQDPFFRRFFGPKGPGFRFRRRRGALGSGVIVRRSGLVITNHHVIKNAGSIKVILSDRREFQAKVILKDKRTDLAVLRIVGGKKGERFPALKFGDADNLEVGDLVIAVGNPFGVGQTVTSGIVSALARTRVGITDFRFFIQTDAAINPGNSGGPLVTMDGRVVGINTAIYSRSGGSVGIGFAIPSSMVQAVLKTAERGGKIRRPWLGVSGQAVTSDIAKALGLSKVGGVIIRNVNKKSPAYEGGLRLNDIVIRLNGRPVNDIQALRFRLATLSIGTKAIFSVLRKRRQIDLSILMKAAPELPLRNLTFLKGRIPLSGAQVGNLSPAYAEELGIGATSGVIVIQLRRGSIAHYKGFRPGDIIRMVNGAAVRTVKQLSRIMRPVENYTWRFVIRRGKRTLRVTLGL